ncbi:GH1 family beta-glucosidase [Hamadaea tsunoensis]|uniref:GH1 family beta-glucosidase n=1 Tax=Hamadaea tsunoensis TaxID=53368 RepID=UPI00040EB3C1|nr:GH1 family beta-glucosidase [Hamadaea tsunoensis]
MTTQTETSVETPATTFPAGFRWGVATASYQIEGAAQEDGRAPSIWDTFSRTPGRVADGHTGQVACDHYHRYAEDIAIMRGLGVGTYRFSLAWPRIQPDGSGPINPKGLDFYDRLVDGLLEAGIAPMATLYHWDLPQTLEDAGGWPNRDLASRFADYALAAYARLGDRVPTWTTLNEPWCSAFLGYCSGRHAPGRIEPANSFRAAHTLMLGHGLAARALRAAGAQEVSVTVNLSPAIPRTLSDPHDQAAARLLDGLHNRIFLDPLLLGRYPTDMLAHMERFCGLDHIRTGDEETIAAPIDFLGVNYYMPTMVAAQVGQPSSDQFPGTEGVLFLDPDVPQTGMGWPIDADSFHTLLVRLHRDYPGTPIMITENGSSFPDVVVGDTVQDADRIGYFDGHLRAVAGAIADGVDLRGYLAWSLLDNFEWGYGYDKRFGLVHVDYATQQRRLKASAHWYKDVIANNSL